jgi:hypothetical protein
MWFWEVELKLLPYYPTHVSLEKILKSMIQYMIAFVVILNIIWIKTVSCNGQITNDKKSLNVRCNTFHHIVIKDKSYIMLRCHIMND